MYINTIHDPFQNDDDDDGPKNHYASLKKKQA